MRIPRIRSDQVSRVSLAVAARYSQQYYESAPDLAGDAALDAHLGAADALNNCPHGCVIYIDPQARASRNDKKPFVAIAGARVL